MKNCITSLVCLIVLAVPAAGSSASESDTARTRMKQLDFLVGEWSGEGWIRMGPGEPHHFESSEIVESRIDGRALIVEGRHVGPEGEVVHHALGVFTWDPEAGRYSFQTYVADRGTGSHAAWLEGDDLVWEMSSGERLMRYTISLDDQGRWHEKGFITIEGRTYQFFEMTLEKMD